ncbi:uncharacterized protein EURHEDRAFT_352562 [Aspergillus ruber CBS 135680]|uniref:Uncharacterized protein n=1 Tax=Aspergillus ruber (strain CBS 135680) TaxID=1388766 RepID=A0A017SI66_ASPRC|nr:uncharacterized protein EURHEDRAFT_352562 [Aspergillus ruber CBS 135680]EYE96446.1 hypothetical protein EURHEDRAFT_352562 [Aspergillus ruber CBS 135680]
MCDIIPEDAKTISHYWLAASTIVVISAPIPITLPAASRPFRALSPEEEPPWLEPWPLGERFWLLAASTIVVISAPMPITLPAASRPFKALSPVEEPPWLEPWPLGARFWLAASAIVVPSAAIPTRLLATSSAFMALSPEEEPLWLELWPLGARFWLLAASAIVAASDPMPVMSDKAPVQVETFSPVEPPELRWWPPRGSRVNKLEERPAIGTPMTELAERMVARATVASLEVSIYILNEDWLRAEDAARQRVVESRKALGLEAL